jgi:hypothetical protein
MVITTVFFDKSKHEFWSQVLLAKLLAIVISIFYDASFESVYFLHGCNLSYKVVFSYLDAFVNG